MKTLVIGGTGTVGSQVVALLRRRKADVRMMVRSEDKPVPDGVERAVGDLRKPETLAPVFRGVDAVFLLNALSQDETEQGLAAVRAAQGGSPHRIVYMSVALPRGSEHIPHFASKIPIEEAVGNSGLEYTILRPNNFFQNDYWFRDVILQDGLYPQPIGSAGINRIDVRDIADAAVHALFESDFVGQHVNLHGPDRLTGEDVARTYSRHLGREVRYGGDDLDAWAQQAKQMLPEWLVHDLRIMYDFFQKNGLVPEDRDQEQQRKAVGHEPRRFDAFVQEIVAMWTGAKV
jgi:uncharacterized protein YbjT (DUF2867 family)